MNGKIEDISKIPITLCKFGNKLEGVVGNYLTVKQMQELEEGIKKVGLEVKNIRRLDYESGEVSVWIEHDYEGKFGFSGEYKTVCEKNLRAEDNKGRSRHIFGDFGF